MSRPEDFADVPWLSDLLPVPENASWPRYMTPVHPDAVGSYGLEFEQWVQEQLELDPKFLHPNGSRELLWWQRLAIRRQLEHDAEGRLVWWTIAETGPRRIGKSVRLKATASWRLDQADRFGEPQLVLHTAMDLAISRKIQERAWAWAEKRWGARAVTRGNGKETVKTPTGDEWLLRAMTAVYGYDVTQGYIDEAWAVPSPVYDEGIQPATMERKSPQIVLTSTAHRRATSLMRRIIRSALAAIRRGEVGRTLLLYWGAGRNDDPGDPRVWRAASPVWSQEREDLYREKYEAAMRGEADPEADDPDPMEGWKAQYLNLWPREKVDEKGEQVVAPAEWQAHRAEVDGTLVGVAVESWFGEGCSVAAGWLLEDGRALVSVKTFPGLPEAAKHVTALKPPAILAGKSLAGDHLLSGCEAVGGTTREAMLNIRRMLDDGALAHDGSEELAAQVVALRAAKGPDGARLVSKARADAVKAAAWIAARVRAYGEAPKIY